jgi:hypothetical protein
VVVLCSTGNWWGIKAKAILLLHAKEALGGRGYRSCSFSTSAIDGGEWSASRPGRALAPGKGPPVPIVQEAGWASEAVWTQARGKILSPLPGIEPRSRLVQPVARHYAD